MTEAVRPNENSCNIFRINKKCQLLATTSVACAGFCRSGAR